MKIVLDQPIATSAQDARAALVNPALYRLGEVPGGPSPALLSSSAEPGRVTIVLGYRFAGELSSLARTVVDPAKLTWSQVSETDLATGHTDVRTVPDHYKELLSFAGWYELHEVDSTSCSQHLEADLRVRLPLLGPPAERAIASGIRQDLAETARLVERFVAGARGLATGNVTETERPGPGSADL
jgi:hypothetical protein